MVLSLSVTPSLRFWSACGDLRPGDAPDAEQSDEICGRARTTGGHYSAVIGAGGVFKQVLVDSGVGPALGEALTGMGLPIAITCFVLAASSFGLRPWRVV